VTIGLSRSEDNAGGPCTDPSETEVSEGEGENEGVELDAVKSSLRL